VIVVGDRATLEYIGRGTHGGPFATPDGVIAATGPSVDAPSCDAYELRHGNVTQLRNSNRRMRWESDPIRTFSPHALSYLQII